MNNATTRTCVTMSDHARRSNTSCPARSAVHASMMLLYGVQPPKSRQSRALDQPDDMICHDSRAKLFAWGEHETDL
eukprot:scaffold15395_cov147-Isochrysis_galbana.AAC.2